MPSHRRPFRLNKVDGKILGVCSGLSDHFDIDVTLVRVAMVLALFMTFPFAGFAYLIVAMVAKSGGGSQHRAFDPGHGHDRGHEAPRLSEASIAATRERMRDLDARMAAIEAEVTTSNAALAREIESLR